MASAQALLKRVARLEQARAPRPFPYPLDDPEFVAGEGLDHHDWPVVVACLRRWQDERLFDIWQHGSNRVWHL